MTATTKLFTLDEYLAYDPPDEKRYELENGLIKEMPTESDINQAIAKYLYPKILLSISRSFSATRCQSCLAIEDFYFLLQG